MFTRTDLISHDHQPPVPKTGYISIVFIMLQTHNLLDILNFLVLDDLIMLGLPNV